MSTVIRFRYTPSFAIVPNLVNWSNRSKKQHNRFQRDIFQTVCQRIYIERGDQEVTSSEIATQIDTYLVTNNIGTPYSLHASGPQSTTHGTVVWLIKDCKKYGLVI